MLKQVQLIEMECNRVQPNSTNSDQLHDLKKTLIIVGHCGIVNKSSADIAKRPVFKTRWSQKSFSIKKISQKSELSFIWVQLGKWSTWRKWSTRRKMVISEENGQLGKNVVCKTKLDGVSQIKLVAVCKIKSAVCSVYKHMQKSMFRIKSLDAHKKDDGPLRTIHIKKL